MKKCRNHIVRSTLLVAAWATFLLPAMAQTAEVKFGQNRVQYKDFDFQYYESDHFVTYFYPGGQDIAKYVIKSAEDNAQDISRILDYRFKRKLDIIVYNNIHELNQTNIGIYNPDQNQGGTGKLPDNKMFLYFNGEHANLDKQIRENIARIYLDKQLSGQTFGQVIGNALLLNLSDWFKKGFVSYLGENWNADMEDRLRDGIMSGRYRQLNKLSPEEAVFVGHSVWHWIEEVYGKNQVPNVMYLTRINRSVDNGFQFSIGTGLNETLENWYRYYVARFNGEIKYTIPREAESLVKKKNKKETFYYQPRLSNNGKFIAYASNNIGRYKVHLLDVEKKKTKVIKRGGWRTVTQWTDQSMPLIAWAPNGEKVAYVFNKRNINFLVEYDLKSKKKETHRLEKFQKVFSFSYAGNSKQVLLSAEQKGQTDVFLYTIASQTVRQITDDYFDDLTPAYVEVDSVRGVVFASNRTDDTLRKARYESQVFDKSTDLFFYDLDNGGSTLYRITETPGANESYPAQFNSSYFSYLSEKNGIRNVYAARLQTVFDHKQNTYYFFNKDANEDDSLSLPLEANFAEYYDTAVLQIKQVVQTDVMRTTGQSVQLTNFPNNIREHDFSRQQTQALDASLKNGVTEFYRYDMPSSIRDGQPLFFTSDYAKKRSGISTDSIVANQTKNIAESVIPKMPEKPAVAKTYTGHDFQSEYDYAIKLYDWDSAAASVRKSVAAASGGYIFRFSKVRPYFVKFMVDKLVGQLNNDLLVTRYQVYNPQNPTYTQQPLNALFKVGITDLLEDHKLYGGITIPLAGAVGFSFSDLGYFLTYENLKKRLDKKITFFRQSISKQANDFVPFTNREIPSGVLNYAIKSTYLELELKYPFDVFHSVRFGAAYRNDQYVFKSEDTFSLNLPHYVTNWVYLKGEYVFDDCIEVQTNIRRGFRAKAFVELHKEIPTKPSESGFRIPQWNNQYFVYTGFDARYYLKIYKQLTLATRLSFATSLGNAKMMHYLGGIDNSLLAVRSDNRSNGVVQIDPSVNYVFQTLSTPMRGFLQSARHGSSYAALNAELRIPIFSILMNRTPKSEFVRNFALVGFCDVGSAWVGWNPFDERNTYLTITYENSSTAVRVKQFKTPVLLGTGAGLRMSLLGYFIKFDMAWGLDTGEWSKKPTYYLSFGYDF
ncbi:MAG: hypothetical protein U0T73_08455 [Chitinophagales bacterium]